MLTREGDAATLSQNSPASQVSGLRLQEAPKAHQCSTLPRDSTSSTPSETSHFLWLFLKVHLVRDLECPPGLSWRDCSMLGVTLPAVWTCIGFLTRLPSRLLISNMATLMHHKFARLQVFGVTIVVVYSQCWMSWLRGGTYISKWFKFKSSDPQAFPHLSRAWSLGCSFGGCSERIYLGMPGSQSSGQRIECRGLSRLSAGNPTPPSPGRLGCLLAGMSIYNLVYPHKSPRSSLPLAFPCPSLLLPRLSRSER